MFIILIFLLRRCFLKRRKYLRRRKIFFIAALASYVKHDKNIGRLLSYASIPRNWAIIVKIQSRKQWSWDVEEMAELVQASQYLGRLTSRGTNTGTRGTLRSHGYEFSTKSGINMNKFAVVCDVRALDHELRRGS